MAAVYTPRSPTAGVLYAVVRAHLADFLAAVEARSDGSGLPSFASSRSPSTTRAACYSTAAMH